MRRILLRIALGALVLAAVGWWAALTFGRPPRVAEDVHGHGHHEEHEEEEHPEGEVHMSPEQMREAGVKVEVVKSVPVRATFSAVGTLAPDPQREVHLSAPLSGRVVEVAVGQGQRVQAGQALVTLESAELAQAKADFHRARGELAIAERDLSRRVQLAEVGDESRREAEEAAMEVARAEAGWKSAQSEVEVISRRVNRLEALRRDGIASDQQLEEALGALRTARAEQARAESELKTARMHRDREQRILASGLVANREIWEAEAAVARSAAAVEHARSAIQAMGADPDEPGATMTLAAPIAGTVLTREVTQGESVQGGDLLLELLDTSSLWLWLSVPETRLSDLRQARSVRLRVNAHPDRTFDGRITYFEPQLDPESRTLRARVELPNPTGLLQPNMFAEVEVLGPSQGMGLAIPASAVASVEGLDVVYVVEEPGHFQRRNVRLGNRQAHQVVIVDGLKAGEFIATGGVFSIKSEDQRESMGEGHAH